MGEHDTKDLADAAELRAFTQRLLTDLRALEVMLARGLIESDVRRIGAEQELFLIDRRGRPAPRSLELLAVLADPHFTTELAAFNLEFNLDPLRLGGDCLARLEAQTAELTERASAAGAGLGLDVVLTGILPTLVKADLSLDNMTAIPRYRALNDAFNRVRGGRFELRIKGRDELIIAHDNVMLEACNTSFQLHFQVAPEEFARRYNIAQAVAAPVLAAAVNSPLLFGRNLWRETRIALLQQSIDTRSAPGDLREQTARVSFGRQWVRESVLEILCEDIARFRVLVTSATAEDPFAELAAGNVPQLWALRLHNGTVYRWNRPCYGLSEGRPHLRIEFRALPAGPSVVDEVANAAFWFGLMAGVDDERGDISQRLDFDVAKENFFAAARHGLAAQLGWVDGETLPADELILTRLLDLARRGLALLRIRAEDADRYLGVLEERVRTQRTGAHWLLGSLRQMGDEGSRAERLAALVVGTAARQRTGEPVARWPLADITEAGRWREHYDTVGRLMSTDLFTVHEDELIDLVAYLMNWRHIKHVPVEDDGHRLVGLVTHRAILRLVAQNLTSSRGGPLAVREVMQHDVITCTPDLPSLEAMRLMRRHRISCLPVVNEQGVLVGIITEKDFMGIAGHLLERFFGENGAMG